MNESFSPAWWLPGAHAQTLWGKLFRRRNGGTTRVERLDTPDGDFLELHHLDAAPGAPVLVMLHGLEGSVRSHYIQGLLGEARRRGWRGAVVVFRSCGNELNRGRRFYHSGETTDLAQVLEHLERTFPSVPLLLVGASLGGNVLLKYLGEQGSAISRRVAGAVAISVPFDLERSSRHLDTGFARVYQRHFLRSLRAKALKKLDEFPDLADRTLIETANTMYAFDDCFTAPVHDFADAHDYYWKSSSLRWLESISVQTLLISAVDDPFLPFQVLNEVRSVVRNNPHVEIDFPAHGGHVGFVEGGNPLSPAYYLDTRVSEFLARQMDLVEPPR